MTTHPDPAPRGRDDSNDSPVTGQKWRSPAHNACRSQRAALRKLLILDAADRLGDLRVPPGNRLEKLKGGRANTYSIRINDQWHICFRWTAAGPEDVEILDYH